MTVQKSPTRRQKMLAAAEGYIDLGMYTHALATLREVGDPGEDSAEFNFLRGDALRHLERHDEALVAFQQALEEDPEDIDLLMAMAWCYKRTDQLSRAIAATEQAYRIAPKQAVLLYNLSCYWTLAGDKTQALSWLGRALRMDGSLRRLIDDETDFDSLRNDSDFQLIVRAADHLK